MPDLSEPLRREAYLQREERERGVLRLRRHGASEAEIEQCLSVMEALHEGQLARLERLLRHRFRRATGRHSAGGPTMETNG